MSGICSFEFLEHGVGIPAASALPFGGGCRSRIAWRGRGGHRRAGLAGAFETPLEPATLLTAGALAAAAAAVVRLGWLLPADAPCNRRLDLAVMLIASLAVFALGGGLCSPSGTSRVAAWFLGAIFLAEEGWAWLWFIRRTVGRHYPSPAMKQPGHPARSETTTSAPCSFSDDVVQELTRSEAADGAEELSGWLRLPFASGQRTGNVHVAFCPPLRATPEVAVEQIEGPDARIKTAQLLPYGARFDLKLAAAAEEPTSVLLRFTARTPRDS